MNDKQQTIQRLLDELSNIEKESYYIALQHFKTWLRNVSLTLEAANMKNELKI